MLMMTFLEKSRLIFIIFLNDLSLESKGGNHNLYKRSGSGKFCLLKSIKPKAGTLILFSNHENAFHGVDEMQSDSEERHFIYGSFTQLGGRNRLGRSRNRVQWTLYY